MQSLSIETRLRVMCFALASVASAMGLSTGSSPALAEDVTAPQMIDAFEGTFGAHPGQRRNHIKGTCAAGEFVGTAEAAALSRSPVFSGKPIPVVARFSLGGGGSLQHFTMINVPIFAASSPASFRDFIDAAKADPKTGAPDPEKLKAYFAS